MVVGLGHSWNFLESRKAEVRGTFKPVSYPEASWYGKSVC